MAKLNIELFGDPEMMPALRYRRFQKYLAKDCELGSTIQDYDASTERAMRYMKHKKHNEAMVALSNCRITVFNMMNEISYKQLAYACLIKSIDGVEVVDYTEDNLNKIIGRLDENGFTQKEIGAQLEAQKKKLETTLSVHFPEEYHKRQEYEYNVLLRAVLLLEADLIINPSNELKEKLKKAESHLLEKTKPRVWNIYEKGNIELEMEVGFQSYLVQICNEFGENPNTISIYRYHVLNKIMQSRK